MRILSLDLSKLSTGFAAWGEGDETAASGTWQLGSEWTSEGRVFGNLHARMTDLHMLAPIDAIFMEETLNPARLQGFTNIDTLRLLSGLNAHAKSWGDAMGVKVIREVNQATWRRHFIGKMPRATKTAQLKEYAMQRCRELGFRPLKHDQAEAIGILDYACDALKLTPPWRADFALAQPLGRVG